MGAVENGALMALAGSLAKIEVRMAEGVEILKDILSELEAQGGGSTSDGDDSPASNNAAPAGVPTGDMNAFMEGMLKNAVASNPKLALAMEMLKQSGGTNVGDDEKKEG